ICLRGASAFDSMLASHRDGGISVFAVWEPVLPTDWWKPSSWALHRLRNGRVTQYWDRERLLAARLLADARARNAEPQCCDYYGTLWDVAAVYPKGAVWTDRLPAAALFGGPIVDVSSQIKALIEPPAQVK